MGKQSKLLIDSEELIVLQSQLAVVLGVPQAVALQQIHYWLNVAQVQNHGDHYFDEQWWCYNTWQWWHDKNFPFWSIRTIRYTFRDLESQAIIATRGHENRNKGFWVTINYGQLEAAASGQNYALRVQRLPGGLAKIARPSGKDCQTTSDTETTTETTQEIKRIAAQSAAVNPYGLRESRVNKNTTQGQPIKESSASKYLEANDYLDIDRDVLQILEKHNPKAAKRLTWSQHNDLLKGVANHRGQFPSPNDERSLYPASWEAFISAIDQMASWQKNFVMDKRSVTVGEIIKHIRGYHYKGGWLEYRESQQQADYDPVAEATRWLKR